MQARGKPVDRRGYVGAEKNRELTPEQVVWARQAFGLGEMTAKELAVQFGMGVESVRRMLRGDTYTNVGEAFPRARDVAGEMEVDESVLRRVVEAQKKVDTQAEVAGVADPVETFLEEGKPDPDPFGQ